MAHRIAANTLNASTIDILNVIRDNASLAYQNSVPTINTAIDIPKVGEVLYGTPAFANEFINALINRIAIVRVKSATFNNPYERLKKGFLDYGETVEEIFVGITKAFEFSQEKAEARELKQYKPNVKSAFHAMNWKVLYPVSVSTEQLKTAFLNEQGVTDLITKIVDTIYTAANYDEFLLFKYLIIKSVTSGKLKPVSVNSASMNNYAVAFRGKSNLLPFMSQEYNEAGVLNATPKARQVIFMDAQFNAEFDVNVLSAAFHMEKADFMGSLFLVDSFATFDNDRFDIIRENTDGLEEVTAAELTLMGNVKALLMDEDWFQVYDNLALFTEARVSSGLRWNYFYHTWKTISVSPFANAIVFVDSNATITNPNNLHYIVGSVDCSNEACVVTLESTDDDTLQNLNAKFVQTQALTGYGYGVQPYGAILMPVPIAHPSLTLQAELNGDTYSGSLSMGGTAGVYTIAVGGTVASGNVIVIDGTTVTLDATSGASLNAAASAVRTALGSNTKYTVSGSNANVVLTEKSGKYGVGAPDYSIASTAGTLTLTITTAPKFTTLTPGTAVTLSK